VLGIIKVTVTVKVSFRVYLLCLLCFCQACCCWHLGSEI